MRLSLIPWTCGVVALLAAPASGPAPAAGTHVPTLISGRGTGFGRGARDRVVA